MGKAWPLMVCWLLVALTFGSGPAGATGVAIGGKTHGSKIQVCSLLTTAEVSAVIGVKVKASASPSLPDFTPGGLETDCEYTDASPPTNASSAPPSYDVSLIQRDFSKPASAWGIAGAKKQFAHGEAFLKPFTLVTGLGDAAFWSSHTGGTGALWTLDGDLVLDIGGQAADGKNVSEATNEGLMKKILART